MKKSSQTGQTVQANTAFFEIAQDPNGQWHWVLWSGNGRMVARNPGPYERRKDVVQAIKILVRLIPTVKMVYASSPDDE